MAAFLFIVVGAFTKTGVIPFHTWIPAASLAAPQSVMAFLPGALDKLLGVYLLARLCLHFFDISSAVGGPIVLLLLGSLTIVVGALMAVLQKDFRRMLAYLAISSSGYMVLGLASGNRIGTAGGLFHMLNGALYISLLFLVAAAVEKRTGKTSLEELGGLSYAMPLTFVVFLIGGLAMSGVPPLSGFFSKWMIYQGLISAGTHVSLFPLFLIAALFGSVLTLACFLKLAHSVFLGHREEKAGDAREMSFWMGLPQIVMAVLTVVFGVFAIQIPLRHLIYPSVDYRLYDVYGWNPGLATLLLLVGLAVGALVYIAGRVKPKVSGSFIGGESLEHEEVRMPGTDFYRTSMTSIDLFDKTYEVGEQGAFDVFIQGMAVLRGAGRFLYQFIDRPLNQFYDFLATLALLMGRGLSELHTGGLRFYLAWILGLGGTVVLVMVLLFG
jgi:multicomponent Na+:H+ antiporter subunit A